MVEIDVVYEGGLRTSCRHGPSGAVLASDAPVDNHGRGESYSPTDLVATGLASCMLTVMGILAESRQWRIESARARVQKYMVSEPVRRIGRLVVEVSLPDGLPERAREPLEQAARGCPVRQSLHPEIEVEMSFVWGG